MTIVANEDIRYAVLMKRYHEIKKMSGMQCLGQDFMRNYIRIFVSKSENADLENMFTCVVKELAEIQANPEGKTGFHLVKLEKPAHLLAVWRKDMETGETMFVGDFDTENAAIEALYDTSCFPVYYEQNQTWTVRDKNNTDLAHRYFQNEDRAMVTMMEIASDKLPQWKTWNKILDEKGLETAFGA